LAPSLKPWVDLPFRFLAHQLFWVLPAWVWTMANDNLIPTVIVGVLLLTGITLAYKAQPARMTLLAVLIAGLWYYGRGWSASALRPSPQNTGTSNPIVSQPAEEPALSVPISLNKEIGGPIPNGNNNAPVLSVTSPAQPSNITQPVVSQQMNPAPQPETQKVVNGTNNSTKEISDKEKMAAVVPTAEVTVVTQQPKPTSTQTTKPDVAGNLLKQVAPGVAGDVAKKLFVF
jgi:hypothetical protein